MAVRKGLETQYIDRSLKVEKRIVKMCKIFILGRLEVRRGGVEFSLISFNNLIVPTVRQPHIKC